VFTMSAAPDRVGTQSSEQDDLLVFISQIWQRPTVSKYNPEIEVLRVR
jgi:hypothetical protein